MLFVFRIFDFAQGIERTHRHLETCIFIEFDERQTHRVHERRNGGHEEVDAVADEQNRNHDQQPHDDARTFGHEAVGQRIEHRGEDAARESDGEQTDVRQHSTLYNKG